MLLRYPKRNICYYLTDINPLTELIFKARCSVIVLTINQSCRITRRNDCLSCLQFADAAAVVWPTAKKIALHAKDRCACVCACM